MTVWWLCAMVRWFPSAGGWTKLCSNFPALSGVTPSPLSQYTAADTRTGISTKQYGIFQPIFPLQQNPDWFCQSLPWPDRVSPPLFAYYYLTEFICKYIVRNFWAVYLDYCNFSSAYLTLSFPPRFFPWFPQLYFLRFVLFQSFF